jgi:hypothetical protein
MTYAWLGVWKGEQVYIEFIEASFVESIPKAWAWGLLGRAKTRSMMLYGRELVARRETKQSLFGTNPEFDLVGKAKDPEGHDAFFHAIVTPTLTTVKCHLRINDEPVGLESNC